VISYADASEIVGTLLDEADPERAGATRLGDVDTVLVSELVTVEVASACRAAERATRITDVATVIARFEAWCAPGGRIRLLAIQPGLVFDRARALIDQHRLYTLDAIHLAVALEEVVPLAGGEPVRFLTRDRTQADAARALGFTVA
jgi:predicted nucleic acid-binding protein